MSIRFEFKGKNAVVTGGAQGIGFSIVQKYLDAGCFVNIWDYSQDALNSAQAELKKYASQTAFQKVNVTDRASVDQAAASLKTPLNFLVNNAGITRDKSFKKMTGEDFDAVIQTNLTGLFNVTKSLLERFDDKGGSRIINISSVVGLYGNFGQTNYAAAKAGVIGMTKTWAKELGRKGFTVNAVAPGFIRTKMTEAMPADVLTAIAEKVPVGRMGTVEDIANACLFLSSDAASYVHGTVLSVDGGVVI